MALSQISVLWDCLFIPQAIIVYNKIVNIAIYITQRSWSDIEHIFHWNFFIFLPLDPDPDSQYGSGSTKSLNPDPQPCHPSLADSYLYISSFIPDGSNVLTGSVRRCQSSLIQPQITHDTGLVPHPVYALDSKCIKYKFLRTFSLFPAFKPLSYNFF
jgi:hypothetical protein